MKKLLFLFVLNLGMLAGMEAGAQSLPSTPSAESMGLIRSIQTPVDLSTGVPQIQVPLYNVESFGIQVPVSLNYHASGLRVEDRPGIVGMGWRLSAGGKITRIVKGYPDGSRERMWGKTPDQLGPLLFDGVPYSVGSTKYVNYRALDTEPDLFYFEIPGRSGMFVFDAQGIAHTVPYQNISITWNDPTSATGGHFVIRDENGSTYTFGNGDTSKESTSLTFTNGNHQKSDGTDVSESVTYTSTWHLNTIQSATGNSVSFSYVAGDTEERASSVKSFSETFELKSGGIFSSSKLIQHKKEKEFVTQSTTGTRFLKTIRWQGGELRFERSKPFASCPSVLSGISLYPGSKSTPDKTILLTYSSLSNQNGRSFLERVDEYIPGSNQEFLIADFYYYSGAIPAYDTKDFDHWGYYNGKGNTADFPDEPDVIEYSITDYAKRSPDFACTQRGVLSYIAYPTGGQTRYIYELNKDVLRRDIGGLRIKEIQQRDGSKTISAIKYEYDQPEIYNDVIDYGSTLGRKIGDYYDYTVFSKPTHKLYDENGRIVTYQQVKEIFPDGSRKEYRYDHSPSGTTLNNSNMKPGVWRYSSRLTPQTVLDEAPTWTDQNFFSYELYFQVYPVTSRFWKRNLLTQVQTFESANATQPVGTIVYEYELSATPRKSISGFIPQNRGIYGNMIEYQWESQPVYLKKTTETSRFAPTVITEYTYNTEHMVPTSVKVTDYEDDYIETSMRYPFHYTIPGSSTAELGVAIRNMQTNRMNPVIETVTKRNGKVVAAELHGYRTVRLTSTRSAVLPLRDYVLPLQTPLSSFAGSVASSGITVDSRYKPVAEYVTYDSRGLLAESNDQRGRTDRYHYNQYGQAVARVSNATSGGSFYTGFEADDNNDNYNYNGSALAKAKTGRNAKSGTCSLNLSALSSGTYELSYWKSTDAGSTWQKITQTFNRATSSSVTIGTSGAYIDEVRVHAKDARMTTSAYAPGIGKISESDALGTTTYYEYNSRGQLWRIYDNDRNLREEFTYTTQR